MVLFSCSRCTFESTNEVNFISHLDAVHSRDNSHWCRKCGKLFSDRTPFIEHQVQNTCSQANQYDHPCGFDNCQFSDKDPSRFIYHLKNVHRGNPLLPCVYCRRFFTITSCLITHIQEECCNRPATRNAPPPVAQVAPPPMVVQAAPTTSAPSVSGVAAGCSSGRRRRPGPASSEIESNKNNNKRDIKKIDGPSMLKGRLETDDDFNDEDVDDPGWTPHTVFTKTEPSSCQMIDSDTGSTTSTLSTIKKNKDDMKRKNAEYWYTGAIKKTKQKNFAKAFSSPIKTWGHWADKLGCELSANGKTNKRIMDFFRCVAKDCQFSCSVESEFAQHVAQMHSKNVPVCCYCFVKMASGAKLAKHTVECHNQRKFQCASCLFRAVSERHVKEHQKKVHQESYVAIVCCTNPAKNGNLNPASASRNTRIQNNQKATGTSRNSRDEPAEMVVHKPFRCGNCNFQTLLKADFVDHYRKEHQRKAVVKCCFCDFSNPELECVVTHFRVHGIQNYECDFCSFGSEKVSDVEMHLCIHHGDEKFQFLNRLWPSGEFVIAQAKVDSTTGSTEKKGRQLRTSPMKSPNKTASDSSIASNCRVQLFKNDGEKIQSRNSVDSTDTVKRTEVSTKTSRRNGKKTSKASTSFDPEQIVFSSDDEIEFNNYLPSVVSSDNSDIEENLQTDRKPNIKMMDKKRIAIKTSSSEPSNEVGLMSSPKGFPKYGPRPSGVSQEFSLNAKNKPSTSKGQDSSLELNVLSETALSKLTQPDSQKQRSVYTCRFCNKTHNSTKQMLKHVQKVHEVVDCFQCSLCSFKSSTTLSIINHSRNCHMGLKYSLINLVYSAEKVNNQAETANTNLKKHWYVCAFCNCETDEEINMLQHLLDEVDYFKYSCKHCTFFSRNPASIVAHNKNNHPKLPNKMEIKKNEKLERWAEEYVVAQKMAAQGNKLLVASAYNYKIGVNQCGMCLQKFKTENNLKGHLFAHLKYKPHQCLLCKQHLPTTKELDHHHKLKHSGESKESAYHTIRVIEEWVSGVIQQAKRFHPTDYSSNNASMIIDEDVVDGNKVTKIVASDVDANQGNVLDDDTSEIVKSDEEDLVQDDFVDNNVSEPEIVTSDEDVVQDSVPQNTAKSEATATVESKDAEIIDVEILDDVSQNQAAESKTDEADADKCVPASTVESEVDTTNSENSVPDNVLQARVEDHLDQANCNEVVESGNSAEIGSSVFLENHQQEKNFVKKREPRARKHTGPLSPKFLQKPASGSLTYDLTKVKQVDHILTPNATNVNHDARANSSEDSGRTTPEFLFAKKAKAPNLPKTSMSPKPKPTFPFGKKTARKSVSKNVSYLSPVPQTLTSTVPEPKPELQFPNLKKNLCSVRKMTARKSVKSSNLEQKLLVKRTARKSMPKLSETIGDLKRPVFKATARKSIANVDRASLQKQGSSKYGCKPMPSDLNSIFIWTMPPGCNTCFKLSGYYVRDMFKKDVRIVCKDFRRTPAWFM